MMFNNISDIPDLPSIKARLRRRNLEMVEDGDWEKHGPHEGQNYMVIIGLCRDIKTSSEMWVSIYPRRIYGITNPSDWWKVSEEDAFPVERK